MKKLRSLLLVLALCLSAALAMTVTAEAADVTINATNFPDATFRSYVTTNFDTDGNGVLSTSELASVTQIVVPAKKITSLQGLEHFTALTLLDCSNNQLTALDVSANTALTKLSCYSNQLSSLNVSANTALKTLSCGNNRQLTVLDLAGCPALTELSCYSCALTELDVSGCSGLERFWCTDNQLTSLDASANTALTGLYCHNNQLTSLNVSTNTALKTLNCSNNQLTSLDLGANTALETLQCYGNQLTSLDVSANTALKTLNCRSNRLTALTLGQLRQLYSLSCYGNSIAELNIGNCPKMKSAYLNGSKRQIERDGIPCWSYALTNEGDSDYLMYTDLDTEIRIGSLAAPVITKTESNNGKPMLRWNAVDGADKYVIYRSGAENGNYSQMFTTTLTYYTNTSAVVGYDYWYKVYAQDDSGNWSSASTPVCVHCCPANIRSIYTATSSGKPYLRWDEVEGAVKYVIYRADSENGNETYMFTTTNTHYTNTSAEVGKTYWYRVFPLDAKGYWGDAHVKVSVQCRPAAPVITSSGLNANGKPTLTWKAVPRAKEYVVYRGFSRGGTYWKMFTTASTNYTNLTFESGKTYWYKVYAVTADGCWSYANAPVSVTTPNLDE